MWYLVGIFLVAIGFILFMTDGNNLTIAIPTFMGIAIFSIAAGSDDQLNA